MRLAADGEPGGLATLAVPMLILFAVMYFMMIRPQKKQQVKRESMLNALKKNDQVVTNGGIFGIVDRVGEADVTLKVDENKGVKIRVARHAIASVIKVSGGGRQDKPEKQ